MSKKGKKLQRITKGKIIAISTVFLSASFWYMFKYLFTSVLNSKANNWEYEMSSFKIICTNLFCGFIKVFHAFILHAEYHKIYDPSAAVLQGLQMGILQKKMVYYGIKNLKQRQKKVLQEKHSCSDVLSFRFCSCRSTFCIVAVRRRIWIAKSQCWWVQQR